MKGEENKYGVLAMLLVGTPILFWLAMYGYCLFHGGDIR